MNHILTAPPAPSLPPSCLALPSSSSCCTTLRLHSEEASLGFPPPRLASPRQAEGVLSRASEIFVWVCRVGAAQIKTCWARRAPAARPPEAPTPWPMGERHSAAGMRVSNYIKAIFTSIPMEVGVVAPGIVCCDFWRVTVEICSDSM